MITRELQLLLDQKQDDLLTGMPAPQDGKVGDLRTNVFHGGQAYTMMKTGVDEWRFSAPFTRTRSKHTLGDYLLLSGGVMKADSRIYFRDSGTAIYSSAVGQLDIEADTQLEIDVPTIDIDSATLDLSTQTVDVTLNNAVDALNFDSNTLSIDALNERVGIGTAGPGNLLHLLTTSNEAVLLESTSATGVVSYQLKNDDRHWTLRLDGGDSEKFNIRDVTAGATRLTIDSSGKVGIGTAPTIQFDMNAKVGMTALGGIAIKLTNRTGSNTVQGQLVKPDTANNDSVILTAADDLELIGVFLESGVANNSEAWVVIYGIADVAMEDNTTATRGNWVRGSITEAGYADATNASAPQPINQTHFAEIGHCIETVSATGGGTHILARCTLMFN